MTEVSEHTRGLSILKLSKSSSSTAALREPPF